MPAKKLKTKSTLTCNSTIINVIIVVYILSSRNVVSDDSSVMALFAQSITPRPSGWSGPDFCGWTGISCDTSGRVSSINLSSKSLSGKIPTDVGDLSGLRLLSLQRNRFSGPLPPLSNMGSLEEVNLDDNSFDSIPQGFLSGLTSLRSFSINNNPNLPPWNIPETLRDSSSLTSFLASKANVAGEIPDVFDSLPNLQSLRLSYNNLSGSLPGSLYGTGILNMWLNSQGVGISGLIGVLASMTQLHEIWLHGNKFSGPIPDLSECTELTDLQLRDNMLTGVIPDSITKLPKLQTVALQNNKLQGPMPSFQGNVDANLGTQNAFCLPTPGPCDPTVSTLLEISSSVLYPMALAEAWEGNDACQGWKFVTCEKGSVTVINFGKQNWTGTISPAFANLTSLKSLLLDNNQLEGTIPESLTSLTNLRLIDLSNNNISGKIPTFSSSVEVKVSGNVFIGKDVPLNTRGSGSSSSSGANTSFSPWAVVIPAIILVTVLVIVSVVMYNRRQRKT